MDSPLRTRLALGTLALSTVAGSFALGAAWAGGDGGDGGRTDRDDDRLQVAAPGRLPLEGFEAGRLVRAGSCADLLEWYVDNTVDRVTAWGWNDMRVYMTDGGWADTAGPLSSVTRAAENGAITPQSSSQTGTNVQEVGVDEPDVVKTDGSIVVRLDGDDLTTYDVSGTQVRRLATVDLPGSDEVQRYELLLVGDRAVVIGQGYDRGFGEDPGFGDMRSRWGGLPTTVVHDVDLSDPAAPKVTGKQTYTASLLSARQYDDTVRLVLGNGLPQLEFVQPDGHRTEKEALEENRRVVRDSRIEDWLPSLTDGKADPEPAVGCDAMVRPEDFSGAGSVLVAAWEPGAADDGRSTIGVAASSSTVYSSTDRLYLATSLGWGWCCTPLQGDVVMPDREGGVDRRDGVTEIHAFALDGSDASYVGSGEVEGSVRDRWSMDSVDGVLRVAVGPTNQTGNANSVVTLREKDGRLEEFGRVDRLGVDEQIMSVRWFDDLAVVVTFRQVDPLYAIDLADPAHPKLLGQLKIPGFSDYLHPIEGDLMIGIGSDADAAGVTRGGQAAVFDLRDLTHPRRISTVGYGKDKQAMAGTDPRQFTWLPGRRTALTVVSSWGRSGGVTGWVSVLEVAADGTLTNRLIEGSNGEEDVANLRALPLPDGRVVLSTEKDVRFLDL